MQREWQPEELIECWTLLDDDRRLVANKTGATRLGFALLLKFFELEGRFPRSAARAAAGGGGVRRGSGQGARRARWMRISGRAARSSTTAPRSASELGFREATRRRRAAARRLARATRSARSSLARSACERRCCAAVAASASSRRRRRARSGSSAPRARAASTSSRAARARDCPTSPSSSSSSSIAGDDPDIPARRRRISGRAEVRSRPAGAEDAASGDRQARARQGDRAEPRSVRRRVGEARGVVARAGGRSCIRLTCGPRRPRCA